MTLLARFVKLLQPENSLTVYRVSCRSIYRPKKRIGDDRETDDNEFLSTSPIPQSSNMPVITVPIPMQTRFEKLHRRKEAKQHEERRLINARQGNTEIPIIECKNKDLNHYFGQTYSSFKSLPLASQNWVNKGSAGNHFTIREHLENPATNYDEPDHGFKDLGLSEYVLNSLEQLDFKTPTLIQALAINQMLTGANVILVSETGGGKTLAYLLPILDQILKRKLAVDYKPELGSPQALILLPTRELVMQVGSVLKNFTAYIPITSCVYYARGGLPQFSRKDNVIDCIVCTPAAMAKQRCYSLSNVRHIVVDEADTLFDDSFSETVMSVLDKVPIKDMKSLKPPVDVDGRFITEAGNQPKDLNEEAKAQLCLVGATMPKGLTRVFGCDADDLSRNFVRVSTRYAHKVMPHVSQRFYRIRRSEKPGKIVELVRKNFNSSVPTVVFTNETKTCFWLSKMLEEMGVVNVAFHGHVDNHIRMDQFNAFQNGDYNIIISTDIGSRGLDTTRLRHVINYDFPHYISDYIHRAGRVGRVGSEKGCKVINLIANPYEVDLVQKIETAVRRTQALENVNANIKRKLVGLHERDSAVYVAKENNGIGDGDRDEAEDEIEPRV